MPTLRELNPKKGDRFKLPAGEKFIVNRVDDYNAFGTTHWPDGFEKKDDHWELDGGHCWERIEPDADTDESPEAVTEPPQHVYAYLAAQYGIVIIADSVTYDGTKQ